MLAYLFWISNYVIKFHVDILSEQKTMSKTAKVKHPQLITFLNHVTLLYDDFTRYFCHTNCNKTHKANGVAIGTYGSNSPRCNESEKWLHCIGSSLSAGFFVVF